MRSIDNTLREEINAKPYVVYTEVKSEIVPKETLAESRYKITCPNCNKKHWYGTRKRHCCSNCNIWVMADHGEFGSAYTLYVSLTKDGLGMTHWEKRKKELLKAAKEKAEADKKVREELEQSEAKSNSLLESIRAKKKVHVFTNGVKEPEVSEPAVKDLRAVIEAGKRERGETIEQTEGKFWFEECKAVEEQRNGFRSENEELEKGIKALLDWIGELKYASGAGAEDSNRIIERIMSRLMKLVGEEKGQ